MKQRLLDSAVPLPSLTGKIAGGRLNVAQGIGISISGTVLDEVGLPMAGVDVNLHATSLPDITVSNNTRRFIPDGNSIGVLSAVTILTKGTVDEGSLTIDVSHNDPTQLQFRLVAPVDPKKPGNTIFPLQVSTPVFFSAAHRRWSTQWKAC